MTDNRIEVNPADLSVAILFPCGSGSMPWQTGLALAETAALCTRHRIEFDVKVIAGSSVVTWARSKTVDEFLNSSKASRAFFIDADMAWRSADFLRFLALSTQYDVICAAYAQKNDAQNIIVRHDLKSLEVNPHGLIKCGGTGLGFTVVTRKALEVLADGKPDVFDPSEQRYIKDIFRLDTIEFDGKPTIRHEDTAFFADLIELGYDVHMDLTVKLGHVGSKVYRNDPIKALHLESAFGLPTE